MKTLTAIRLTLLGLLLPLATVQAESTGTPAPGPEQQAATPAEYTEELIDLLSRTEIILAGCTSPETTAAATPQLRELAALFHKLQDRLRSLPEPSARELRLMKKLVQGLPLAQDGSDGTSLEINRMRTRLEQFNLITRAIEDHILRLRRSQLITPELQQLLRTGR